MIDITTFLQHVYNLQIPPGPPEGSSPGGRSLCFDLSYMKASMKARDECTKRGMWAIVDQVWTKTLADWIGRRKVLEVMAGAGWLARALDQHGVNIVATDDFSWKKQHSKMKPVYEVRKLHALEAVIKIKADILLVSWPPYEDETISAVCRLWGSRRPIIYIGESEGGCNAPDSFWQQFKPLSGEPNIPLMSWDGIHDRVWIGYWATKESEA